MDDYYIFLGNLLEDFKGVENISIIVKIKKNSNYFNNKRLNKLK